MPSLSEKLSQAANTASWKVDQQFRLNGAQTKARGIEDQIHTEKLRLADLVLSLAAQNTLSMETVKEGLAPVYYLVDQLNAVYREIEAIKNETPPAPAPRPAAPPVGYPPQGYMPQGYAPQGYPPPPPAYAPPAAPTPAAAPASGLVCPNCGAAVAVRFCEQCGTEGTAQPPAGPETPAS